VLSLAGLEPFTVYADALSNAGICYARLGEFARAEAVQRRAIELDKGRGPRRNYAQALGGLGNTFLMKGDARGGLAYLRQALAVTKASNLPSDAAVWAGNVAAAAIDLGEWDEAARVNEEARALRVATRTGNLFHTTLNAAQIAQGRGQLDEARRLFDEALRDGAADASVRWSAHWGLAEVALARSQSAEASNHFQSALDTIEQTRAALLQTDSKLSFLTRLIRFYQQYVDTLIDRGRAEQALEVSESSRGRVLAEGLSATPPARVTAAALRQIAGASHSVLVAYWLAPSRSSAWVVHARGIEHVTLPPAGEIAALVREYRSTIDNTQADPLAASGHAGDRLYTMLVAPIRQWVPTGSRVVIAADGALHGLNFETLPVAGPSRHYLIEDLEIQMTPGLSVLTGAARKSAATASLLLLGDPAPRPPEFPPLRYAPAEIASVSKYFPSDRVIYQGAGASPAAYRAAAPQRFAFVHFTAHAAANMSSPLDSAVILAGPDGGYKLYAREVASLPLTASLVTVSACRSAGERAYAGEGLVGFAWAFLRAGARRVIAGLWDVDDRSTAALMDSLYARISAGDAPSTALRAAKLSVIAKGGSYAKPYYWGPFQLFSVEP
jgi:CHAT domain-containing protein